MKRMTLPLLCRLGMHRWRRMERGYFNVWQLYRCERCWTERVLETPAEAHAKERARDERWKAEAIAKYEASEAAKEHAESTQETAA